MHGFRFLTFNDYPFLFFTTLLIIVPSIGCSPSPQQQTRESRPNIIVILADDMGYSDIGAYGSEIETTNLDQLAGNGIRFRNFYNAARCCPTRAALLTGLYPHEAGMGGMVSGYNSTPEPGPYQGYLNEQCVTLAEVLKEAGYATYMSGKWHVGEKKAHWPRKRGFDRYFGLISGASSYFQLIENQPIIRQMVLDDDRWTPPEEGFYMTQSISDHAVDFLQRHFKADNKAPFFLYLAYTAPHWPLHALREDIKKYEHRYDTGWDAIREARYKKMLELGIIDSTYPLSPRSETVAPWEQVTDQENWARRMTVYAAMVDRIDQGIGQVVNTLKENKALNNTLILFLSDNGGSDENIEGRNLNNPKVEIGKKGSYVAYEEPWANASNTPYRKYKKWTHQGGIATPLIAHWPKGIRRQGAIENQYAHIIDIMPTCVELAKARYPDTFHEKSIKPMQGTSLTPVFEGNALPENRTLYWEHFGHRAVRQGDWKAVYAKNGDKTWELYQIADDPVELNDVSARYPDKVEELKNLYKKWAAEVGVK